MAVNKVVYNNTTLIDLTGDTVDASKVLSGYTAHDKSGKAITGTIATKTSSNLSASGATVTVPAGYYASQATKSVATGKAQTPATTITSAPTISIDASGKITASNSKTQSVTPTVTAGYVSSGTAGTITVSGSNTKQLTVQSAKTVTPSTSNQTAVASGVYTTGAITVKGDSNLVAGNILKGKSIFGVAGTLDTDSYYNNGYNAGLRTLQGSFALNGYIEDFGMYGTYPCPSGIYTDFYCDGGWYYEEVDNFDVGNGGVGVHSTSGLSKYVIYEDGWYDGDDTLDSGNLRLMYIDILEPVQVSQELYDVLNKIIDTEGNNYLFDIGYDSGQQKGYNDGHRDGYDDGYEDGRSPFENLPEPLVIQAEITPYYNDVTEDYYFDPYWAGSINGYELGDYFDYEVVADSDKCHFTIENFTNRPVKVLCYGYLYDDYNPGLGEECYGVATIPPYGTTTVTLSEKNMQYPPQIPIWEDCNIEGVKFI